MPDLAVGVPPVFVKVLQHPFDWCPAAIGDRESSFARKGECETIERRLGRFEVFVPAVKVHNKLI